MARPRKVTTQAPAGFAHYVAKFKAEHPEAWEELRLCPLQHGLEEMAGMLD